MNADIVLSERLDYQAVPGLVQSLSAFSDEDLIIDAGNVKHIGGLALQVLMSAIKSRAAIGQTTRITDLTDDCVDHLSLFGFTPESLSNPETWQ